MMWNEIVGTFIVGMGGAALSILIFLWYDAWQQSKQWIKKELRITYWTMKQYEVQAVPEKISFFLCQNETK